MVKTFIFALAIFKGTLAQLVEQRTENPCVRSSILRGTTKTSSIRRLFYIFEIKQTMKNFILLLITIFLTSCETTVVDEVAKNGEPEGPHT